jgi:hypothetical protein
LRPGKSRHGMNDAQLQNLVLQLSRADEVIE